MVIRHSVKELLAKNSVTRKNSVVKFLHILVKYTCHCPTYSWPSLIGRPKFKAQLTRTACEQLFCSSSDARNGVSCRQSRLQDAVGCKPKWTATCSRLGREDIYRQTSISVENRVWRKSIVVLVQRQLSTRNYNVAFSQWQRCVFVLCVLTLTAGKRFFYGWCRRQPTTNADTDCILPFMWVAYSNSV